jgi:hypothetical protein
MANQKLVTVVSVVDLASSASITLPHDLSSGGVAVSPTMVAPDRATPIVVEAVTATSVTFRNDSAVQTSANFRLSYELSLIADPTTVTPIYWEGVPVGGGGGVPGPVGPQGPQGIQGPAGPQGIQGAQGAPGASVTIEGSVATVGDLASKPQVSGQGWIVQADGDLYVWDASSSAWESVGQIVGPQGPQGIQGVQGIQGPQGVAGTPGAAATVAVGTVTGLPSGSSPTVANAGTATAAVLNFGIPAGATGATGPAGPAGPAGAPGTNAVVGVPAGSYGDGANVPAITVNSSNQITNITPTPITPAGIGAVPTSRTVTAGSGLTGGGDLSANRTLAIAASGVTPGSYTAANITVGADGRVTAASSAVALPANVVDILQYFGDGSDGDVTLPTSGTGITTLTKPMFYNSLTIPANTSLRTNGWPVLVKGTLDVSATNRSPAIFPYEINPGDAGATPTAGGLGATTAPGLGPASVGGGNGGAGATTAASGSPGSGGAAYSNSLGASGGGGGTGGRSSGGGAGIGNAGGAGGTPAGGTPIWSLSGSIPLPLQPISRVASTTQTFPTCAGGGAGGGGGGSNDTNAAGGGGGGGAGGKALILWANTVSRGAGTAIPCIAAKGGNGGNGGNANPAAGVGGGGAGGGGGGGGFVIFGYLSVPGTPVAGFIDASGGDGGNGGNGRALSGSNYGLGGQGGQGGRGGVILSYDMTAGVVTAVDDRGTAAATATTATNSSGTLGTQGVQSKVTI